MATLRTLRQEVAQRGFGFAQGNTSGSTGSLNALIDASQDTPFDPTATGNNQYRSWWAFLPYGPSATGTLPRETSRWSAINPLTGRLTVAPAFSAAVPSGTPFELFGALPPEDAHGSVGIRTCINRALRKLWREWFSFVSLIPDFDMEASGTSDALGTLWTAGTNSQVDKVTLENVVISGKRVLRLRDTPASATSAWTNPREMQVVPGETYVIAVRTRPGDGAGINDEITISLQVLDPGDVSTLTTLTSIDVTQQNQPAGLPWRWLVAEHTIPSGRYNFSVRLAFSGSSPGGVTSVYFDDLIVLRVNDNRIALPSWLTDPARQLVNVYAYNLEASLLDGAAQVNQESSAPWDWYGWEVQGDANQGAWLLLDPRPTRTRIPLIHALRTHDTLSDEFDETDADQEKVVLLAKIEGIQALLDMGHQQDTKYWAAQLDGAKQELRERFGRINPNPPRRAPQFNRRY